jgi:serine protease
MRRFEKWAAVVAATCAVVGWSAGTALAQPQARSEPGTPLPHVKVIDLHHAYAARLGHTKRGKISGIVYPLGKQPKAAARRVNTCTEPNCPLLYNGGPVQHSPHVYLLLWGPNWSSDPGQVASAQYMINLFGGLGAQPQDNWSTTTSQYGDGSGFPTFTGTVFQGAFQDTTTPPSGTTQSQFAAEADAFTSALGISDVNNAQIIVATQSGTFPECFDGVNCQPGDQPYCAWHSSSSEPYTNLPYILDAGANCGEDFVNSNGTYDGLSIVGGHEYAESVTDPYPPSGWVDPNDNVSGGEIGDKCAWAGQLWGSNDPIGNVTLSSGTFAMQSLWSNKANGCVMSTTLATGKPIRGFGGKCLDDARASTTNGNKVDIYSCNGTAAQKWTFSGGKLSVLGKCLADHLYTGVGTKLVIWSCIGHRNELWTHRSNGEYVLQLNGLCLTDPSASTTNGTQVQIRACRDLADQRWSGP